MLRCFNSLCYAFDIFKTPINFLISSREKHSNCLGFLLSIIIFTLLLQTFFFTDFILKRNPSVSIQSLNNEPHPLHYFTHENFSLFVTLTDLAGNTYYDPTIFRLFSKKVGVDVKTTKFLRYDSEELVKCDNMESILKDFSIKDAICLKNYSFMVGGYFDQNVIFRLDIDLERCKNGTNVICKSEEEISKFFNQKFVNIYLEDRSFDLYNLNEPIKKIYSTNFISLDKKLYKQSSLFIKKVEFISDTNYLYAEKQPVYSYSYDKQNLDFEYIDSPTRYIRFSLYSSLDKQQMIRRYQKIPQLFSELGGIANILIIIGYLLINIYNKYQLRSVIINKLYDFQPIEKNKKNKSKKKKIIISTNKINSKDKDKSPLTSNIDICKTDNRLPIQNETCNTHSNLQNTIHLEENFEYKTEIKDFNEISRCFSHKIDNIQPDLPVSNIHISHEEINIKDNKSVNSPIHIITNDSKNSLNLTQDKIKKKKKLVFSNKQKNALNNYVKNNENKLYFSFWDYIKLYIYKIFNIKKNIRQKLFEKSMNIFTKEFDVLEIMTKLKEIDKLKIVIFNKNQLELFNLLEKQMIYIEENKKNLKETSALRLSKKLEEKEIDINKIKLAYENIVNIDDQLGINKRLIEVTNSKIEEFHDYMN